MKITVNGTPVTVTDGLQIKVEVDPAGETLPILELVASGGQLEVYRSRLHLLGTVSLHLFGEQP